MTDEKIKNLYKILEQCGECEGIKCKDCYFQPHKCSKMFNSTRIKIINKILTLEKLNLL